MTSKTIDTTATEQRQAIAAAKGGRRNAHVPMDLRKRALELLEAGRARGLERARPQRPWAFMRRRY